MDEELRLHLEAMEGRLMDRINRVLERLLEVRADVRYLRIEPLLRPGARVEKPGEPGVEKSAQRQ